MPFNERLNIIKNLSVVDLAYGFNDSDNSAKDMILRVRKDFPTSKIIFANGGDRTKSNIPEMDVDVDNIEFVFGVGGMDKKNSSSWILEEWKQPKTNRQWGYYRVLHDTPGCKVKELTVEPNKSLSMQKHKKRNEFWLVSEGSCVVYTKFEENGFHFPTELGKHQRYDISYNEWHKLTNPFDVPCKIIEIQYGEECIEEDIERE